MAVLCLDLELERRASEGLHEYLRGDWALLFSHPRDFDPGRRTSQCPQVAGDAPAADALCALHQALQVRRVRPLTVKRDDPVLEPNWIDELEATRALVNLREPPFAAADEVSFGARRLRGEVLTLRPGFVLIVDGSLKRRGVFKYVPGHADVLTHDLLASVDALRGIAAVGKAA